MQGMVPMIASPELDVAADADFAKNMLQTNRLPIGFRFYHSPFEKVAAPRTQVAAVELALRFCHA
jgi:hypothetical protein